MKTEILVCYLLGSVLWEGVPSHFPSSHVCMYVCAQSCLTLCNTMDYSLPDSSVHGISQTRILEWVAISSSRFSS